MVILASEDIGNADPQALGVAVSALHAFELMGLPEGVLPMTQAALYLACAPKSNAVITTYGRARAEVQAHGALAVPRKLRNAPTGLMKQLGYGSGYKYPHEFEGNYVVEDYLPDELVGHVYYTPSGRGREKDLRECLADQRAARGSGAGPQRRDEPRSSSEPNANHDAAQANTTAPGLADKPQ